MKYSIILVLALLLSSCAFIKTNIATIAGGASAVATAPIIKTVVLEWFAGDKIALEAAKPASDFFAIGHAVITKRGADIPVVTLAVESPEYIDAIPTHWSTLLETFDEFENRTGKPRPALLDVFIDNSEASYKLARRAIDANDRIQRACGLYAMGAPIAAMFSPIRLPSKIPGCG